MAGERAGLRAGPLHRRLPRRGPGLLRQPGQAGIRLRAGAGRRPSLDPGRLPRREQPAAGRGRRPGAGDRARRAPPPPAAGLPGEGGAKDRSGRPLSHRGTERGALRGRPLRPDPAAHHRPVADLLQLPGRKPFRGRLRCGHRLLRGDVRDRRDLLDQLPDPGRGPARAQGRPRRVRDQAGPHRRRRRLLDIPGGQPGGRGAGDRRGCRRQRLSCRGHVVRGLPDHLGRLRPDSRRAGRRLCGQARSGRGARLLHLPGRGRQRLRGGGRRRLRRQRLHHRVHLLDWLPHHRRGAAKPEPRRLLRRLREQSEPGRLGAGLLHLSGRDRQ